MIMQKILLASLMANAFNYRWSESVIGNYAPAKVNRISQKKRRIRARQMASVK